MLLFQMPSKLSACDISLIIWFIHWIISRALDLLLTYRPNKEQFPIIVTQVKIHIVSELLPACACQFIFQHWNTFQDCGHKDTQAVIESYGDQIIYIQQPGWSKAKSNQSQTDNSIYRPVRACDSSQREEVQGLFQDCPSLWLGAQQNLCWHGFRSGTCCC